MLTAVKKMEDSLKRLKKGRGTEKSGSQGLTDDDKIRQQLILDIGYYGDQVCRGDFVVLCRVSLEGKRHSSTSFLGRVPIKPTAVAYQRNVSP